MKAALDKLCDETVSISPRILNVDAVPDPRGGGKRGTCPPPPPKWPQGIPCPQKKKLIFDLMTPKASCEKMVPVRVAHSNPTYAITECKNGRALVKHGNIMPLIGYQTTPHSDARNSSVRLNREMREWTLPPTLIAKTYHPGNVTDVSRPLIRSLSYEFQCHQRKTNTIFEAYQSALSACSIRHILCGTGLCHAATICNEWVGVA